MFNLTTKPELIAALNKASTRELSASALHDQRVSFIMSSMKKDSSVTRAQVEREIAKQEGLRRD